MIFHLTQQKCPLCSRFSSGLKKFLSRFFGFGIDCQDIERRTHKSGEQRVAEVNAAAPDCACEKHPMSKYSPHPVENSETLARFIWPMFVDKKGKVKPNVFSHVYSKGCSIQRDSVAENGELLAFVKQFLTQNGKQAWKGVIYGQCGNIRSISADNPGRREVCVYDTAKLKNPAHGELFQSQYVIDEADRIELREKLFTAFGNGNMISPLQYRDGAVWNNLPHTLQARS